ncbi:hypothetical protein [Streptomyces tirandamycinicus]|uniref:hypothetical protein n=1 Tax=Streptomyces tirandamycinicus TaxID=2174846 RepID=UPI001FC91CD3|nr:hypothetical protein [Streptomyces tirandamycinicus]
MPRALSGSTGEVCGKERIPVEDGVLPLVVRAGAGSVRDSMSVMDQLLAGAADDGVTYAMATGPARVHRRIAAGLGRGRLRLGRRRRAFEVVDRVVEGGNDPRRFVADLLERCVTW